MDVFGYRIKSQILKHSLEQWCWWSLLANQHKPSRKFNESWMELNHLIWHWKKTTTAGEKKSKQNTFNLVSAIKSKVKWIDAITKGGERRNGMIGTENTNKENAEGIFCRRQTDFSMEDVCFCLIWQRVRALRSMYAAPNDREMNDPNLICYPIAAHSGSLTRSA